MSAPQTWGLAATILAPADEILKFAAYHLRAGAHRLYLYLDEANPTAYEALKAHPKIRVTTCDDAYWEKRNGGRPKKHQVRQTINATHAYHRRAEVDWLIHMDVDEFLVSDSPLSERLTALPVDTLATRIRPMEALSGDGTAFKGFIPPGPQRAKITSQLYPTFGAHINGGFLSHLAGKVMLRTGLDAIRIQIHNAFQHDVQVPTFDMAQCEIALAHIHAKTWDQWIAAYRFRLTKGSYRAELAPNKPRDKGGLNLHDLFQTIEASDGEAGLHAFYVEVCADSAALRARLDAQNLLILVNLDLNAALSTYFPKFTP